MVVFFPEELIYEILLRIPAAEILKFKSVCKRWWFLIISDPKFADAHLRYHKQEDEGQIIVGSWVYFKDTFPYNEFTYYFINIQENGTTPPHEIQLSLKDTRIRYSCNGMLLVQNYCDKKLTVYNPITCVGKHLPPVPKNILYWALVQDTCTKKYKVFGITSTVEYVVFTQGETNWKYFHTNWKYFHTLAFQTFNGYKSDQLICLENKLHWTASFLEKNDGEAKWNSSIYSIDVADEERITRTKIPFKVEFSNVLSEVSGSLYITNTFVDRLETWVLKDMANNLWSKCCSIGYGSLLSGNPFLESFVPPKDIEDSTTFLDQGKYVGFDCQRNLSVYDMKGKELRKFALPEKSRLELGFSFHINSLVNWE